MSYLSILSILRNEVDFVIEFINFYKLQGVEHFYFYDNDSTIPLEETLKNYLDICTITKIHGDTQQINAYNHFLKNFKDETEWIAVFDLDEYVYPKRHESLKEYIESMGNADCISINWVIFGNGKHLKKPDKGFLIENYLYSEGKQHNNVKSIVKTSAIKRFYHPHFPKLKWFKKHVNAIGNKMHGAINCERTIDTIQLNHYFTKSLEEYKIKLDSKRADNGLVRSTIKEDMEWLVSEPERTSVYYDDGIWEKYRSAMKRSLSKS